MEFIEISQFYGESSVSWHISGIGSKLKGGGVDFDKQNKMTFRYQGYV